MALKRGKAEWRGDKDGKSSDGSLCGYRDARRFGPHSKRLTAAKEFREAGEESTIIFDGAGTRWIPELSNPDHQYHEVFESLKDQVEGACSYCSSAFGVKEEVQESGVTLLEEHEGHPSLYKLVSEGYEVITF